MNNGDVENVINAVKSKWSISSEQPNTKSGVSMTDENRLEEIGQRVESARQYIRGEIQDKIYSSLQEVEFLYDLLLKERSDKEEARAEAEAWRDEAFKDVEIVAILPWEKPC